MGRLLKTDARIPPNRESPYLFSGIARCAVCKNTLIRKTVGKYKYYCCSLAKTVKGSCIGCHISVDKFDTYAQQLIREHIDKIVSLREQIAADNIADKLQRQITRLQDEVQAVEIAMDRRQFLLRSLEPSVEQGILTKKEANEFREMYQAEHSALEQNRRNLFDKIRQIEDGTVLECRWAEQFMPYAGQTIFSRKDIVMLVESIFLYKDKRIEICFVHDQEFQYIRKMLE